MLIVLPTPEYVSETDSFDGGLAVYVARVAQSLREMGHRPVVLVAADRDERFEHGGVEVRRVRAGGRAARFLDWATRYRFWPTLRWSVQGRRLARAVRAVVDGGGDAVVQYPNYTALAAWHRAAVPAVVRCSSYQPVWVREHGHDVAPSIMRQISWWEHRGLRRARALFAPSRLVAAMVEKAVGRKVAVIPSPFTATENGGRLDANAEHTPWGAAPYFLFFGSLSPMKGIGVIAAILGELLHQHRRWHFVFAGRDFGAPKAPWSTVLRSAAGAAADRVHCLGRLDRSALAAIVARADIVVLPSVVDNLPNAVLEAMAAGRMVVGTSGSSIDEIVTDEVDGLLCPAGDGAALRATLDRAVAMDPAHREQLGRAARRRVGDFAPERVVAQLIAFYREAMQR